MIIIETFARGCALDPARAMGKRLMAESPRARPPVTPRSLLRPAFEFGVCLEDSGR